MKTLKEYILVAIFSFVFIAGGTLLMSQSYQEAKGTTETVGKVVDVSSYIGRKGGRMYTPVIEFYTPDGKPHRFTASISSSWQPQIGDIKPILYKPNAPELAIVKSIFDQYIFPGIFIVSGALVLFLFGALDPLIAARNRKKERRLRSIGRPIQAQITGAAKTGYVSNRIAYFAISAQWIDTTTNKIHLFESFAVPFDPVSAIKGRKEVTVYINPSNSKDYWMDTSFLPIIAQ